MDRYAALAMTEERRVGNGSPRYALDDIEIVIVLRFATLLVMTPIFYFLSLRGG